MGCNALKTTDFLYPEDGGSNLLLHVGTYVSSTLYHITSKLWSQTPSSSDCAHHDVICLHETMEVV